MGAERPTTERVLDMSAVAGPLDRIRVLVRAHLAILLRYQKRNVTLLTELRAISARHRGEVLALRDTYERFVRSTFEKTPKLPA